MRDCFWPRAAVGGQAAHPDPSGPNTRHPTTMTRAVPGMDRGYQDCFLGNNYRSVRLTDRSLLAESGQSAPFIKRERDAR